MFGAILKATNRAFQKGITFCRSIYVKKVMKLLAFIFEQPSYTALCIDQQDPDTFTRLVLDPSAMVKPSVADEFGLTQVELYTREYIHEIHKKRVAK